MIKFSFRKDPNGTIYATAGDWTNEFSPSGEVFTSLEHQHQREKKSHEKKQKTYCGTTDGQYAQSAGIYTPHWATAYGKK